MSNLIGSQVGKYRLLKLLGQGAFAQVYLGEHLDLKRLAAIKILTSPINAEDGDTILKEAQTIARLSHPHIVRVWDFDVYSSHPYLLMDYYPHGSLRQRHPKGSLVPPDLVISYAGQIAKALQYAHDNSIIHRDIKPENLLLNQQNEVVLTDFGIATMTQSARQTEQDVAGTAAYMAPEQFKGNASRASDQYALGVIIYEWLTGRPPFRGSFSELAGQHMLIEPPPLRTYLPRIPARVEQVIMRALMKDPQQRFATVQEFADALQQAYPLNAAPPLNSGKVTGKQRHGQKRAVVAVLISLLLLVSIASAGLVIGISHLSPSPHPCVGFSDKFQQNNIDGWKWINPANESKHTIEAAPQDAQAKVLHISSPGAPPYEDLNPDKNSNLNAPRLVQPVDGDFTIETQVDFTPNANAFQGAGLVIWQNAGNFLRLEVAAWKGQFYGVNFVHYDTSDPKGSFHDNGGNIAVVGFTTKLRVERKGNVYTAFWQQFDEPWRPVSKTFTMSSDHLLAGLLLMNAPALLTENGQTFPTNEPAFSADGYYHYFHYTCNNV